MKSSIKGSSSDRLRQVATIVAILSTFGINIWSNLFPLNGLNIGAISNTFFANVQIIPANYAFAIWGVIYVGLFALGIYQLLPGQRQNLIFQRIDYFLILACVAQVVWVFLFLSRLFWLSVVAMLGILLALIAVYVGLGVSERRISRQEKWLVDIPISVYLGWISVATIVNIASALYSSGWNGWGISAPVWTVIMLVISAAIAAILNLQRQDAAFPLVIIWAFVAIWVRQQGNEVAVTAIGLAILLAGLLLITQWRSRQHPRV